jgi:Flp pilus assembly protein TadB
MPSTDEILKKYSKKIEKEISSSPTEGNSREYIQFKQDMLPEMTRYKKWAEALGRIIKIKVSEKEKTKIQKYLDIGHIDLDPAKSTGLSVVVLILFFFLTGLAGASIYLITGNFPLLFVALGFIASIFVFYYVYNMPRRLANIWRLKASSQMVPAILYIVVYMKHTSNLERAIEFASQHLEIPLSLDLRKVFYDVEIGKFSTIKQSLDHYLETWRDYAPEFIESFHLIESSLFEPSEAQRVKTLERALQIILDGVYDKMLRYSREIRTPLTNIYMLGIILPTLGLALLPLAATLLGGAIRWEHVLIIFNIIIPFFVYYMTSEVLLKRPGGHGESSVLELNPKYPQFTSRKPWTIAFLIAFPMIVLGFLPFIFQIDPLVSSLGLQSDYTFEELGISALQGEKLFDFKTSEGKTTGPFGIFAVILSFFIPLSIAFFFGIAYKLKTKELIKARNETKTLEKEFTTSMFQLGNRLGDGTPAEIAFAKVAESTKGQKTQNFFALVNQNIQQMGMSLQNALFNPDRGAIIYYPSALIATSMRILVESVKKGLKIAARSLMSISDYIKNIQKINERLRDLLAEVVSDMRSNMVFLAPLLSGIVVGLSAMITIILNKLKTLGTVASGGEVAGFGDIGNIVNLFDITSIIPPYFIQVSIGLYLVEIVFILTAALVTVDAGKDKLKEKHELAKNLKKSMLIYITTALLATLVLSVLAGVALSDLGG